MAATFTYAADCPICGCTVNIPGTMSFAATFDDDGNLPSDVHVDTAPFAAHIKGKHPEAWSDD